MANNQYINKVEFGGNTLIDLTSDTVAANKMLSGYTAHDKSGATITGTIATRDSSYVVVTWQNGHCIFLANSGYYPVGVGKQISDLQIPVPSSGTNSIAISVPNGTTTPNKDTPEDWITLQFSVDSSGNSEITDTAVAATGVSF